MSREIKFKAKRFDNGEWVYGSGVIFCDDCCFIDKNDECYIQRPYSFRGNTHFIELACIQCNKETISQFTGFKDKNGKEIYEGDIIRTPYLDPIFGDIVNDVFENAIVEFNNGSFIVKYSDKNIYLFDLLKHIEIIGNAYDNSELLKDI